MSGIRWYLPFFRPKNFVRIVRLQGNINANSRGARALNFRKVEKSLEEAFDTKRGKPRAVCLEINSMGGSAVQSNLIYQRVRALSKAGDIPVLSFAEDAALSGGYWLALAGDEIFVDANSAIGSIGALYANFGFSEVIKKLGEAHWSSCDQFQISPEPLPEILHHIVWRTWFLKAYCAVKQKWVAG